MTESEPISLNLTVSTASSSPRVVSSMAICRNQSFIFDVSHRKDNPFIFLNITNQCHKQSYLIRTRGFTARFFGEWNHLSLILMVCLSIVGGTFPSTFIDVGTIIFSKPQCPPSFNMKITKVRQPTMLRCTDKWGY